MNRGHSVELGVWMNAWATSQQTGLLRGIGGQLKKLETAQHEATEAQRRLAEGQELQTKQLEGIQLTQQEILTLQRQQLDLQTKDRADREQQAALKQLVFELQIAVERIAAVQDAVARYLLFQGLHEQLRATDLAPEQLEELADKRACHDVTAAITSRVESIASQLSEGEQHEVATFLDQAGRYSKLRHFDHDELTRLETTVQAHPMANSTAAPEPVALPGKPAKWWLKAGAIAFLPLMLLSAFVGSTAGIVVVLAAFIGPPAMAIRASLLNSKAASSRAALAKWNELSELKSRLDGMKGAMAEFDALELRDPVAALPRYSAPLSEFGKRHPDVQALVASISS